jgi:hypothetical protein
MGLCSGCRRRVDFGLACRKAHLLDCYKMFLFTVGYKIKFFFTGPALEL